tara:strand:+ start:6472 stop:9615 length:3144 start_codon:yes stop_codon:yes gene_type:complete
MSWRDARSRVNSGAYKQKKGFFEGEGFANATNIIAKSWMQDAANDKEAKQDLLKEQKAERTRIREEQRDEDKKNKDNRNVANAAIAQAQLPNSTEVFEKAYTMAQGGATQATIYDYFLKGINKGDITIIGPEQGPGMPRSTNILTDLESGSGGANALLNQSQTSQFKDINVSTMPIGEVMAFQQRRGAGSYHAWSKENMPEGTAAKKQGLGSTPAGKYQFVGDTLKDLKENGTLEALGITDDTIFDEKTQDALFVRYAQDRLKGKVTDDERISEMRSIWEGLKKASDEEVLSVISQVETGVFDEGTAVEDRSMMGGETAVFDTPGREYDPVDISSIKTFEDWSSTNANIKANKLEVDPEFMTFFNERGDNLKALAKTEEADKLFSMEVLLAPDMTAAKLKDRIELATAKGIEVPANISSSIMPIIEGRTEYTQAELIAMPASERALVAKFSTNENTRSAAEKINIGDIASYSWISEASSSADAMAAKAAEFSAAGDTANFNLANTMATSLRKGEALYKDLLKPAYFVGKSVEDLTAVKRIAESSGATEEELTVLNTEIKALGEIVPPIEWSTINVNNFDGFAKELNDDGRTEDALLVLDFGRTKQNPPMSLIQLDAASDDLLAILSRETTDKQYKSRIDSVIAQKKSTTDALEKDNAYRKYADGATSVNKTEQQISLAKTEGADNTVIQALETLKAQQQTNSERQKAIEKNGFDIVAVEAKVPLGDDKFEYKTVYQKPGVTGYIDAEGNAVTDALPLGSNENDAFKTIRTETQKLITELGIANTALGEGMNTATQAIEIVEEDARVTGAGGKLAKFLTSAGRSGGQVLSVAEELFKTNEEITLDQLQRRVGFDNDFLDAVVSGNVQNLADATARFEAKMLSLAFQVGRMEGQSGNAMSNQDFRKIMEIVRTSGGSAVAFKRNLTDYMAGKIEVYDQKHFKVVGPGSQIQGFKDNYGFSPVSEPLNMADYVAAQPSQTMKDNYARFTETQVDPAVPEPIVPEPAVPEFKAPTSKAIEYLKKNPGQKAAFDKKFGAGAADKVLSQVGGK